MPASPDLVVTAGAAGVSLPVNPFVADRYHFGMLLGVDDLETEQGYHRGKAWLHQAWLHGPGVVWGLGVSLRGDLRELAVAPGLAVTPAGREAVLDREQCLDLGRWFEEERPDDLEVDDLGGGVSGFTVHVVLHAAACLDRPVPAIANACDGGDVDTAYSRTMEVGRLELRPGPVPAHDHDRPFPRVRQLFGLAVVDDVGVAAAQAELAGLAGPERAMACARWLHALAADDVVEHGPPTGHAYPLDGPVSLAQVEVRLSATAGGVVLVVDGADPSVADNRVRPTHLPTRLVQDLSCACCGGGEGTTAGGDPGSGSGEGAATEGPRIDPASAELRGRVLSFRATAPLDASTVGAPAFTVRARRDVGWTDVVVQRADLEDDGVTVSVHLRAAPTTHPVRLIGRGTGPEPLLGADGLPVAGLVGGPPASEHDGNDFALMVRS